MKMSDIMRDIADLIDQKMNQASSSSDMDANSTQKKLTKVEVKPPEDTDQAKMVPPLQAKLEILKKSEGLPNVYDDCEDDAGDELTVIKKNAGLSAAQQEASEDNDVLG